MKSLLILTLTIGLTIIVPTRGQAGPSLKEQAIQRVEQLKPVVEAMSSKLWEFSETGLKEQRSARVLIEQLKSSGFQVATGVAGMPTAFVATFGSGRPVIGILAEFDALPGVGNAAVPRREARVDGVTSGHGCGHNLFGAASVGGAIAIKEIVQKAGVPGTLKLFGTPAEETLVGKVYMAKAGLFGGLDAVIDWHPQLKTRVNNTPSRAMNSFEVEFFGQAAHGSSDPWNGRSALDAVEMMNFGVNLMREHVKPTARIHYVIPRGGDAPNVVPEYARVWYYVRDIDRTEVSRHYERILKIAEGAAMATDTTHKVRLITGVHAYLHNRPLQEALQANLVLVGPPAFTEEEQAFGRELQRSLGLEETGFRDSVEPLAAELQPVEGGSTDVAEVSWIAPTAGFSVATAPDEVPWHSWATSASHGTSAAKRGAVVAAKVIAATGVDLLTEPALLESARAFFVESTQGRPYVPPIPVDQAPPLDTVE